MTSGVVYKTLKTLLEDCIKYFEDQANNFSFESGLLILRKIQENLSEIEPLAKDFIGTHAGNYDVSPGLEANGYRSLLSMLESLLLGIIQLLRTIQTSREYTFFRINEHLDKLEIYSNILHQMRALLYYAQILMSLTPNGELFIDEEKSSRLMHDCEIMAKACFYGSLHGFQYCDGLQPVVHSLSTFVAQFNDVHKPSDVWAWVKSAINSSRYVVSPELRGEKLEQVYNGGDVEFFKKFWSLHEHAIAQAFPNLVGTSVQVNRVFKILPTPFKFVSSSNPSEKVRITFPANLNANKPILARLLSTVLREGQDDSASPSSPDAGFDKSKVAFTNPRILPKSKNLIFFCHGGGFIALTSKSYEIILRQWSTDLDSPIFSVDYSLAPEAPFPAAFEECFYAYAWALKNCQLLGTTAEKIVFVGDSAGGNLVLSVALRAGLCGIRVPDCIVAIYPACIVRYSASPARLMSVMDPLLPLGVLSGCLSAYSGVKTVKVKRGSLDALSSIERPVSPSQQPVKIKYLSNLFKDVEEGITRIRSGSNIPSASTWWDTEISGSNIPSASTWWDTEICHHHPDSTEMIEIRPVKEKASTSQDVTIQESNSTSPEDSQEASMEFKVKLPQGFKPLRSKFCGDNFQMHQSPLVKNAFMSPALADDELVQYLPHVDIVGCEFDPLFDDSVVLAKRLEKLKKSYRLHVVRQLPHGFLNFQIAKEAREASGMCLDLIKQGLKRTKS